MLSLKRYRAAGVPLLLVTTADPANVVRTALRDVTNGTTAPLLIWDCIQGIRPQNDEAAQLATEMNSPIGNPEIATSNPVEALKALRTLANGNGQRAVAVMVGLGQLLTDPGTLQALWNLRDVVKTDGALVIVTAPLGTKNPLPQDMECEEDSLPTRDELRDMTRKLCKSAKCRNQPDDTTLDTAADALIGLSAFAAEQAIALSLSKDGIDLSKLRIRKIQQIDQTKGLTVYPGSDRFADIGGLDEIKTFLARFISGPKRPRLIVHIDEIEKQLGGAIGGALDGGVSADVLGVLLKEMEDNDASGLMLVGVPGAAKSAISKTLGNECNALCIAMDLGGMKGSLVGQSEAALREAMAIVRTIGDGRTLFVATSNDISRIPAALSQRFSLGTFYFDLPSADELAKIWPIWIGKYKLDPTQPLPATPGWTGRNIKQACNLAYTLGMTLIEAATRIIPSGTSAAGDIEKLRNEAHGKYLSASAAGAYKRPEKAIGRQLNLTA